MLLNMAMELLWEGSSRCKTILLEAIVKFLSLITVEEDLLIGQKRKKLIIKLKFNSET